MENITLRICPLPASSENVPPHQGNRSPGWRRVVPSRLEHDSSKSRAQGQGHSFSPGSKDQSPSSFSIQPQKSGSTEESQSIRRARASRIKHGLHFPETDPNIITKTFSIICTSELCRWLTESMLGKTAGHDSLWFSQPRSEKGAAIYHVRLPGCCEVHGS